MILSRPFPDSNDFERFPDITSLTEIRFSSYACLLDKQILDFLNNDDAESIEPKIHEMKLTMLDSLNQNPMKPNYYVNSMK